MRNKDTLIQQAAMILEVPEDEICYFSEVDGFNGHNLQGVLCRRSDHRYGALVLFQVDEEECCQLIYCTPKLHYPFDRNGAYDWPDMKKVIAYNKLDGTNILAYHYQYQGQDLVSFKTRLTPVLRDGTWGSFNEMWAEYLEGNPWVKEVIDNNKEFNLSFELFGYRNAHTVHYQVPLESNLLFGVNRVNGDILPPKLLKTSENTKIPDNFELQKGADITSEYNRLRENMSAEINSQKEMILEGLVLYADVEESSWRMFKCKPKEIEHIHWAASGFIPKNSIFATAVNAYESSDNPSLEYTLELLREEFDQEAIERSLPRIRKIYEQARDHMVLLEEVNSVYVIAREKGFDVTEDKNKTMQFMSQYFPKKKMKKVGSIILTQAGLIQKKVRHES